MKIKPVLGLTLGDPAGIGPEICLRALGAPAVQERCVPVLFGDAGVLEKVTEAVSRQGRNGGKGISSNPLRPWRTLRVVEFEKLSQIEEPLVVDCAAINASEIEPGKISAACGRAACLYVEQAIRAALAGRIDAVVTAPIHKESLNLAGVKFPGHTEIFTALTKSRRSCMMLYSDKLTVSMATTHIGYADVPQKLSARRILDVIELTAEAMSRILRRAPRLGVCGLNPHAGEHGLFGHQEEDNFVEPAVALAREKGVAVTGPLVPDAAFTPAQRLKYDAIVTLYHDQGHIPFKMLAFDTGVNLTLGLPIIRTSVDHGTAFDIAWQGKADPTSLFSAIRVAADLARTRTPNVQSAIGVRNGGGRAHRKSKIAI
ncbi:MAG TPA: 4-hydroxythreonine-4-phosphate dehydrogenase PdxA [Verrucomicrobiae bacterium]|nr:4-hydroxythreonine-4-phosphate dehydrogenase PdxA [Verrucomicrobiae bacterium]